MILDKTLIVIMPAYNVEKTLLKTYEDLPYEDVDEVILVDDSSKDNTLTIARELGIKTIIHMANRVYGGNHKTCFRKELRHSADIMVMVHPDYQDSPRLATTLVSMILSLIIRGSRRQLILASS